MKKERKREFIIRFLYDSLYAELEYNVLVEVIRISVSKFPRIIQCNRAMTYQPISIFSVNPRDNC